MNSRTSEETVTFRHAFALSALDGLQPAGTYRLVLDEEEIPGLSFVAFRRTATMLHVPDLSSASLTRQVIFIDPAELAAALEADGLA